MGDDEVLYEMNLHQGSGGAPLLPPSSAPSPAVDSAAAAAAGAPVPGMMPGLVAQGVASGPVPQLPPGGHMPPVSAPGGVGITASNMTQTGATRPPASTQQSIQASSHPCLQEMPSS